MSRSPPSASAKDRIYAARQDQVEDFIFDEKVANVFADMIARSVPGYGALNALMPAIADRFIHSGTNCYDLGCSLGEAALLLAEHTQHTDIQVIAVDNSPAMIDRLRQRLADREATVPVIPPVTPLCRDVMDVDIDNASLVVLNFTLQFIAQAQRDHLIAKIRSGLNYGGVLLLSEKVAHGDAEEDTFMQALYETYKRKNDYSDLEISQKREALERVLIKDTHEQHIDRLQKAGFEKIFILAKHLNFVSYVAIK